jgi:hypothetical protein
VSLFELELELEAEIELEIKNRVDGSAAYRYEVK